MMESKNVLLAGGKGFLGRSLEKYFNGMGFEVRILTRNPSHENQVYWDGQHLGDWIAEIEWADVLINLTGKSVDCRYTAKNKKEIINSRVESTAILAKAIKDASAPPETWLNAASSTIYIHSETQEMTEDEGIIGDDFSMNVCKKWEAEFFKHELNYTRRVALRSSIVLGGFGGAYPKLKQLTRLFMGGKQGNGNQFVSWIHVLDFCRAVDFLIHHPELVGPVNLVSPKPSTNTVFMEKMRQSVKRAFGIGQPKWLLEIGARIIGTESELLLKSRNVVPERLLESGFNFSYPELDKALEELNK